MEAIATALSLSRGDTTVVADTLQSALAKDLGDTAGLGDTIATGLALSREDTGALVEAIATALSLSRGDTAVVADTLQSALAKGVGDTDGLGDTVATGLALSREDTGALVEAIALMPVFSRADTGVLVEAIATALSLSRGHTAVAADTLQSALAKGVGDTAGVGDTVATGLVLSREDTAALVEAIATALGLSRGDTAVVADTLESDTSGGVADTAGLDEVVATTLDVSPGGTAVVEDAIQTDTSGGVADTAGLDEVVATTLDVSPGGTAVVEDSNQSDISGGLEDAARLGEGVELAVHLGTANLGLTKADSGDPVLLEQELTYTLTVTNKGPSTGTGVTVVDTLPPGTRFVSASASCRESGSTVTCALDPIASGDSATATIVVIPNVTGALTNTAIVTGNVADLDTGDNTTSRTTTVNPAADLSVTKSDSPDPVLVGSLLTYTLTVVNKGPSETTEITLEDTLPAGVSFLSASAGCGEAEDTVTCAIGTLASGDSVTVSIAVRPGTLGTITNTVEVTGNDGDPSTGDNTATETTRVNPSADLSLTKSDSPDPVLLGSALTYTLAVNNDGPSEATGVTLTDTLPAGVSFVSASASCNEAGGTVACAIGTLATGDGATVSIVVNPTGVSTINNAANVTANEGDPNTVNNRVIEATRVNPAADLVLIKEDSPDPVLLNGDVTYTLAVNNKGPSEATEVTVTDTLPAGVSFLSASAGCRDVSGTISCTMGTLGAGDSAAVNIVVTTTATGDLTNTASVSSEVADPNTGDNTGTETTFVGAAADLVLTKSDSPDPVLLGEEFTYTLTVINKGPSYESPVGLTDTLPPAVSLVSSTSSQGTCSGSSSITCVLGSIAGGDVVTVDIVVIAGATGDHTNTAVVSSGETDPRTGDNTATETTTVNPAADLVVTKSDSPDPVFLGRDLTYTLTVRNLGPSEATGVTLTDTLPARVNLVSAPAGCAEADGAVTCVIGTIAAGDSSTVNIVVSSTAIGSITNTVRVTANEGDPNTGDNATVQTTTVDPAADLGITKADSPDPVLLRSTLTYTLTVSNKGPSEATGVVLTDTLPAVVNFVSASTSCLDAGGTVTCQIGTLASGDSTTVSILVSPTVLGAITNTARVTGAVGDPSAGDNSSTTTTSVATAADLVLSNDDSADPVLLRSNLTYTLTVINKGPSEATGITLIDTLPANSKLLSASGNCAADGRTVTCGIGTLASGDASTVSIVVTPTTVGAITNVAEVSSNEGDSDTGNNTATETTTVSPAADLSLTKTDSPYPLLLGSDLAYGFTVRNGGPSEATGVILTDTLPAGVRFVSGSAGCEDSGGTVTCPIGTLGRGDSAAVNLVIRPTAAGTITNTASVTGNEGDPNTGDNAATEDTRVDRAADLVLTKSDSPDTVSLGDDLTYTLTVVNRGPSAATFVTLTDTLPPNARFVSASDGCEEAGGFRHLRPGDPGPRGHLHRQYCC